MTCIDLSDKTKIYGEAKELMLKFTKDKLCTLSDVQLHLKKYDLTLSAREILNIATGKNSLCVVYGNDSCVKEEEYIKYKTLILGRKKKIKTVYLIEYDHYISNPNEDLRVNINVNRQSTIYKKTLINDSNCEMYKEWGSGFIKDGKVYKIEYDCFKYKFKLLGEEL